MVSEEILMIERIGMGAAAFILTYILLRKTQDKAFEQSDKILHMAETVIRENTTALQEMFSTLEEHIAQKDAFIQEMKECRHQREEGMKELRDLQFQFRRD